MARANSAALVGAGRPTLMYLVLIREMCVLTVPTPTLSSSATSCLESARSQVSRTSISRALNQWNVREFSRRPLT